MKRVLASTMLALGLVACSSWTGTGTVVAKLYDDADSWVDPMGTCIQRTQQGACVSRVPMTHHDPEHFSIKVQDSAGETHEVAVSSAEYDSIQIGDNFTNGASS